jgi:hypothetical protein
MRILTASIIVISFIISSCGRAPHTAEDAQSDPTALAETIVYLIQNEKYDALPGLVDEQANEDSKQLAALKDADETKQGQTTGYFESASIGAPVIDGDKAIVKISLSHGFEETFEMVNRDGKWYLLSY